MSRFTKHVSVLFDFTGFMDWVPVLPSCHHHLYTAPPPVLLVPTPFGFSVEFLSIIGHPPGALIGDHKMTSTVYHNSVWIALEGHDLGKVLLHVCVPPTMPGPCTLMAFNIMLSSRKAKFAAGEVKANGTPIACCTMIETEAVAPTPMMICGAVPIPAAGTGTAVAMNSMLVGMHWIDMIAGWEDVAISMIQSAITNMGPVEAGSWSSALGFEPIPDFGSLVGNGFRLLGQTTGDYHGDATFQYQPLNSPLGGGSMSVVRDGATHDVTVEERRDVRLGGLVGGSEINRTTYRDSDGAIVRQEVLQGSTIGGGSASTGRESVNGGPWQPMNTPSQAPSSPFAEGTDFL